MPIPPPGCSIYVQADVDFGEIELQDLYAHWTTRSGKPAMHIDFDFPGNMPIIEFDTNSFLTGFCAPDPFGFLCLNLWLDDVLPDGHHELTLSGVDLDLYVKFDHTDTDLITDDPGPMSCTAIAYAPLPRPWWKRP